MANDLTCKSLDYTIASKIYGHEYAFVKKYKGKVSAGWGHKP